MKIRTDFVTNSSSTATTELVVENPVLLEILERYKKLGAFGKEGTTFGIGEYATPPSDIYYFGRHKMTEIPKPAFSFREDPGGDGWAIATTKLKSLSEILELIIYIMDKSKGYRYQSKERYYYFYNEYDLELYSQMIEELEQKKESIDAAYSKVNFFCTTDDGESSDELHLTFNYSQEEGIKTDTEFFRSTRYAGEFKKGKITPAVKKRFGYLADD